MWQRSASPQPPVPMKTFKAQTQCHSPTLIPNSLQISVLHTHPMLPSTSNKTYRKLGLQLFGSLPASPLKVARVSVIFIFLPSFLITSSGKGMSSLDYPLTLVPVLDFKKSNKWLSSLAELRYTLAFANLILKMPIITQFINFKLTKEGPWNT